MDDNFLSQFAKKDTQKESNSKTNKKDETKTNTKSGTEELTNPNGDIKPTKKSYNPGLGGQAPNPGVEKTKKSNLDAFTKKTENSKKHNRKQKIATTEHIVEKDDGYQKRKMIRYGMIGGSVFIGFIFIFILFSLMNRVEIIDFVGTSITDANTWGLNNRISIDVEESFDLEYEENQIIEQSVEANKKLQKGSALQLTVSKGPDPDEIIELPDFESMTTNEVNKWRQDIRAHNVNVREEYSDEIEEGHFIKKEFGRNVDEDAYHRRDGLVIFMSKGEEVFEANITVPDFNNKSKLEVESWAKENEIDLTIEESTSSTVEFDHIISQSIEANEKIAKRDEMTVVVSLGKSITVPNFSNYTSEDAVSIAPELNLLVQQRYSSTVSFGRLISQSVPVDEELIVGESMPMITLVYSLGQPFIEDLVGTSVQGVAERFYEFTSRGANITYTINYVDSSAPKGEIVWMSKYSEFLPMTDHININVSRGNIASPVTAPPADNEPDQDLPEDEE